jgi:homospermidine synthase
MSSSPVPFSGRILFLGCGSVAQCSLPLVRRELDIAADRITILDFVDNRHRVAAHLADGVHYVQGRITPDNLDDLLSSHLAAGDICLDLAWNIDFETIMGWCRDHGVHYLNTSVEVWDPYEDAAQVHPIDRTLYVRHMSMRRMIKRWGDNNGASSVVEHGANPGLASHWTKEALVDIASKTLHDGRLKSSEKRIEAALANRQFNHLAHELGVKVIHIAERDTQISHKPKLVNEFVNTWSVDGLYEEGVAPAELGWGTHERRMPAGAFQHAGEGPGNQICLAEMGCKVKVRSRVPSGDIVGMVIRHGESFTITDHLTVWDGECAIYRPTVHYAYCPTDAAIASLHELEMRNFEMQPNIRIMNDEIDSGLDELGVLLMGHPYNSWWTGSLLSIDEARRLVPGQSATTVQVAASVVGAVVWMVRNPNEGLRVPDDLPYEEILRVANPYLGPRVSDPIDWHPLMNRFDIFANYASRDIDPSDPWQFSNFMVR